MNCPQCGKPLEEENEICGACSFKIEKDVMDDSKHLENLKNEKRKTFHLFYSFVGTNTDYYINQWDLHHTGKPKMSFNFATAFLGIYWMAYRRMFRYIFALLGFYLLFDAVLYYGFDPYYSLDKTYHPAKLVLSIVMFFIMGSIGNYLYYRKACNEVEKVKRKNKIIHSQKAELNEKGGTNPLFILFAVVLFSVYSFISRSLFPAVIDPIDYVQESSFKGSDKPVYYDLIEHVDYGSWHYWEEKDNQFVTYVARDWEDNHRIEIQFLLDGDSFEIHTIEREGNVLTDEEKKEFLENITS
jgi:hypothetical protein